MNQDSGINIEDMLLCDYSASQGDSVHSIDEWANHIYAELQQHPQPRYTTTNENNEQNSHAERQDHDSDLSFHNYNPANVMNPQVQFQFYQPGQDDSNENNLGQDSDIDQRDEQFAAQQKTTQKKHEQVYLPQVLLTAETAIVKPKKEVIEKIFVGFRAKVKESQRLSKLLLKFIKAKKCTHKWFRDICKDDRGKQLFFEYLDKKEQDTRAYDLKDGLNFCRAAVDDLDLWEVPYYPQNLPHQIGNNFQKWVKKVGININLYPQLQEFIENKVRNQQSKYELKDFINLCRDPFGQKLFVFYLEYESYIDFNNSKQITHPEDRIQFIEQYVAGAKDPENWNSHFNPIKKG